MLLKPINPNPIHKAIDASVDNELSCEVLNTEIVGSQFYVWNENGGLVHQSRGTITDKGLSYTLPANTIENGKDYSWDTVYWGEIPNSTNICVASGSLNKAGNHNLTVLYNYANKGTPFEGDNLGTSYIGGFCNKTVDEFYVSPEDTDAFKVAYTDLEKEGSDIVLSFYNSSGELVASGLCDEYFDRYVTWRVGDTKYSQFLSAVYVDFSDYGYYPSNRWDASDGQAILPRFRCGDISYYILSSANDAIISPNQYIIISDDSSDKPYKIIDCQQADNNGSLEMKILLDTPMVKDVANGTSLNIVGKNDLLFNTSPEYYFRARQTPSFSFNNLGEHTNEDGLTKLTNHFHNFNIKYSCESVNLLNPNDINIGDEDSSVTLYNLKKNTAYIFNFEANYVVGIDDDGNGTMIDITQQNGCTYISAKNMQYTKVAAIFNSELDTTQMMMVEGDTLPATFVPYNITPTPLGEYQIVVSALDERNKYTEVYRTKIIYNPTLEDSSINFSYDGFVSGNIYSVEIYGKTIEGDIVNKCETVFAVEYSTDYSSDISVQSKKGYVDILIENPWDTNDDNYLVVLRQDNKSLSLQKVCEIPLRSMNALGGSKNNIRDYNVASKNTYTYYFAVKTNGVYNTECNLLKCEPINVVYTDWFVIGLEADNSYGYTVDDYNFWIFGFNISSSPIVDSHKHNYSKNVNDNFGRYASLSTGRRNYAEFTLNCLIGDITCDGEYYDDIEMVDSWKDFCHSSCVKLYKNPQGRIMLVDAISNEDNNDTNSLEDPTTINATFNQIGDTYNTPIYSWRLV